MCYHCKSEFLVQWALMTQILLVRHAVNDFVKTGKLAGWTPEVHLNEEGKHRRKLWAALGGCADQAPVRQPARTHDGNRRSDSPAPPAPEIVPNAEIGEVRYGDWEGMEISALRSRKMWHVVQEYPSRAYFPNGETMRGVQMRGVNEIERLAEAHPRDLVVVVSHADLIKMVMAHFLGMHLDNFQRIVDLARVDQHAHARLWASLRGDDQRRGPRFADGTGTQSRSSSGKSDGSRSGYRGERGGDLRVNYAKYRN